VLTWGYEVKMKLLKDRKFAVLITVIVAVIATMYGVYRTSVRNTREIEAMFYSGVYLKDEGYMQASMNAHLSNSLSAALGLATIMENYPEYADRSKALEQARDKVIAAKGITEKGLAYSEMWTRFTGLSTAVTSAPAFSDMSARDAAAVSEYTKTLNSANWAMVNSRYNNEVFEYLDNRSALMRVIGVITPTETPGYFTIDVNYPSPPF